MKKQLFIICLFLISNLSFSQVIVMDVVQIKDGMEAAYEKVEEFIAPVMGEAVSNGDKMDGIFLNALEEAI